MPIGTWCHLLSKWEEMKRIEFTGLMEEGSGGAKWLRLFPALILGLSGTNQISFSPAHPAVYKSQAGEMLHGQKQVRYIFFSI